MFWDRDVPAGVGRLCRGRGTVGAKAWGWDKLEELEGIPGLGVGSEHGWGAGCLGRVTFLPAPQP